MMFVKRKIYKVRLPNISMALSKTKIKLLKALTTNWNNIERIRKKTDLNWFSVKSTLLEMKFIDDTDGLEILPLESGRVLFKVTQKKFDELHSDELNNKEEENVTDDNRQNSEGL